MKRLITILAACLMAVSAAAQSPIANPVVTVSATLGPGYIGPLLNGGSINFATDADITVGYTQQTGMNVILKSTASLTTTRNLFWPLGTYLFAVRNATSGGQSINVIGTSGTGCTIPNGQSYLVHGDGTNFYCIGAAGSGSFTALTGDATSTSTGGATTVGGLLNHTIPSVSTGCLQWTGSALSWGTCGGGAVSSVANSDSTLTVSPTTGSVVASLNLGHANTWTATQTFPSASITNSELANSSTTVNGATCTLGGTCAPPVTCGGNGTTCLLQQINPTTGATTTVASTMTTGQTTIPVASGMGFTFAPGNLVIIENNSSPEFVACTGYSSPNLTGCTRGVYGSTAGAWTSGTTVVQVTTGYSTSSTTFPYFYTLANGAVGYNGSGNIVANTVSYSGSTTFLAGAILAGTSVDLYGGNNVTTVYTPQATFYNPGSYSTQCETSGPIHALHSTGIPWATVATGANCTLGTNLVPAGVYAFVPGSASTAPTTGATPAGWITPAGVMTVNSGVALVTGGSSSNCFKTDGSNGACASGSLPSGNGVVAVNSGTGALATNAQVAAFNNNTIWASAGNSTLGVSACALNTNINTGGGTDDTSCLQADLDALGTAGGGTLYINGYALLTCSKFGTTNSVDGNTQTTALQTHSNVKIDATGGGVFLQANSNCTVLGNNISGSTTASSWQTNIAVVGGIWNGNGTNIGNQSRYEANVSTNFWNMGFFFGGFNGLTISGVTVRNATTFEITISNGTNFVVQNSTVTEDTLCTLTFCNNDGLHLWGTLTNGFVSNFTGINGDDDFIALNTDEGQYLISSGGTWATAQYPSRLPTTGGAISNVLLDNLSIITSKHQMRLYGVVTTGGVATLSNITFRNVTGAPTTTTMQNSGITGCGGMVFENWNLTGTYNTILTPACTGFSFSGNSSVTINNSSAGSGAQVLGGVVTATSTLTNVLPQTAGIADTSASGVYFGQFFSQGSATNNYGGIQGVQLNNAGGAVYPFTCAGGNLTQSTINCQVGYGAPASSYMFSVGNSLTPGFGVDNAGNMTATTHKLPAARKGTFVCTAAGTIIISNTNETATSDVIISLNTAGGTISTAPAMKTVTAGTGFTVLCGAADTSTYNYSIWN